MWRGDFGAMPVVAGRKVVGMITDRDICMAAATKHRDPANIRVKEVMSGQVYGCSCDTDIHEALKIMQQKQVRRLPIISPEDGRLQGILSMNDVALKAQGGREAELSAEDVESTTLRAICTHRAVCANKTSSTAGRAGAGHCISQLPPVGMHMLCGASLDRIANPHSDVAQKTRRLWNHMSRIAGARTRFAVSSSQNS